MRTKSVEKLSLLRERVRRREIEKGRKRNEPQIEYLGNEAEKMEMVVKYR